MIKSLLYVSRSRLKSPTSSGAVEDIVTVARSRNATLGVTGALMATRSAFAQVLEGAGTAIDELMVSISADHRHTDVKVLRYEEIERRRFPQWTMAYAGLATYVAHRVEPLLGDGSPELQSMGVKQLLRLMEEFGRDDR